MHLSFLVYVSSMLPLPPFDLFNPTTVFFFPSTLKVTDWLAALESDRAPIGAQWRQQPLEESGQRGGDIPEYSGPEEPSPPPPTLHRMQLF